MLLSYKKILLLSTMAFIFISATAVELRAADDQDTTEESKPKKKSSKRKIVHVESSDSEDNEREKPAKKRSSESDDEKSSDDEDSKKPRVKRIRYVIKKKRSEESIKPASRVQEETPAQNNQNEPKEFNRYSRPQLYFAPSAPWRIVYFSPNISYQGMVPVEGDTNLCLQDKEWCLNLKTKEPDKSCADLEFFKKVTKTCEDVQVLSCVEHAKTSSWAQEKWKDPQEMADGIQAMFHSGMEMRVREFVDRGGKLPWVPTPPWCTNVSPKSCSDLDQFDPRTGVNQGGKNFMMSMENCHFYEVANCTAEAIESQWARKRWGDDLQKIRTEINKFIFEKHLERISKYFPASMAVSEEDAKKAESFKTSSTQRSVTDATVRQTRMMK